MPQLPPAPVVERDDSPLVTVRGTFYRAVDPSYAEFALDGSRSPGRYSPADVPTLYLSSSREGVAAAMIKHAGDRALRLEVLAFEVAAEEIADLRDADAMARLGVDPADAACDWHRELAAGVAPRSWRVREALQRAGAAGLIDPSRKRPGLWHPAMFDWNGDGNPSLRRLGERRSRTGQAPEATTTCAAEH